MRASSFRTVLRLSAIALVPTAAIIACGDDSSDMEYQPGAPAIPEADTGASSSSGTLPTLPESGILPTLPEAGDDAGADDAGDATSDASSDAAEADAGDALAEEAGDADAAVIDAGNDPTLGAGPLNLALAGFGIGTDSQALTGWNFAANNLNRWASATTSFDHGTTTFAGADSANAIMAWGQWTNGVATEGAMPYTWPANGGAVYVVVDRAGTIPTTASPTTFALEGRTPAILGDGSANPGTISGAASVFEHGSTSQIGLSLDINLGTDLYSVVTTGGDVLAAESELIADATGAFAHTFSITSPNSNTYCVGSCLATVRGYIGGANAAYLVLVVHIYKNTSGEAKSISAGIVFEVP